MIKGSIAQERASMPPGTDKVLDRRSLEKGNKHIIPFLKSGMSVLDVGCGSGAITKGIGKKAHPGKVVGIDVSQELIEKGIESNREVENVSLQVADVFDYNHGEKFDLVTSARTLQWLSNPLLALKKMKEVTKPGGVVSILDYNHEKIEWQPEPPQSMQRFYSAFLKWRSDAGMNNRIADDLKNYFAELGFSKIEAEEASENSSSDDEDFIESASIWIKVAETRGKQMVNDCYITDEERLQAITDYKNWLSDDGKSMKMYLLSVSGYRTMN